jgi:heme-degrading monooxygenase HmoA
VANGMKGEVTRAFRDRPRLVDDAPGFLGLEVFTSSDDAAIFHLVTRWTDEPSFRRWHGSDEHRESHAWMPKGLKLDASFTRVQVLERIEDANPVEVRPRGPNPHRQSGISKPHRGRRGRRDLAVSHS